MKKRLVSLFLALAIIVTMMPYNLWAREGGGLEDQKNRMAEILGETEKILLGNKSSYNYEEVLALLQGGEKKEFLKSKATDETRWSENPNYKSAKNVIMALALGEDPNQLFGKENLNKLTKKGLKGANTDEQYFINAIALILAERKDQVELSELKGRINGLQGINGNKYLGVLSLALYDKKDQDLKNYKLEMISNMDDQGVLINLETTSRAIQALYAMGEDPYHVKNPQGKTLVDGLESLYRGEGKFAATGGLQYGQESNPPYYALADLAAGSSAYGKLLKSEDGPNIPEEPGQPARIALYFAGGQQVSPLKEGGQQVILATVYDAEGKVLENEEVTYQSSNSQVLKHLEGNTFQAQAVEKDTWVMVTARSKTKPEITGEIQVLVTKKTSSNPAGAFTYEINSDNKGVTITGYRGKNPERLVIPGEIEGKPVTKIGKEAFKYGAFGSGKIETAITSLELPDTLEEIDNNAFRGNKFASLVFPKSLKIIGEAAFESNNLESIDLPEGLETIKEAAFSCNSKLKSVKLPSTIKEIQGGTFRKCQIEECTLPAGVEKLGKGSPTNSYGIFNENYQAEDAKKLRLTKVYDQSGQAVPENTHGVINPVKVTIKYVDKTTNKDILDPETIVGRELYKITNLDMTFPVPKIAGGSGKNLIDYTLDLDRNFDQVFAKKDVFEKFTENYFTTGKEYTFKAKDKVGYTKPADITKSFDGKTGEVVFEYSSKVAKKKLSLRGEGLSSQPGAGDLEPGQEIQVSIKPPTGKKLKAFKVNGQDKTQDLKGSPIEYSYSFTLKENTTLAVEYEAISYTKDLDLKITEGKKDRYRIGDKLTLQVLYHGQELSLKNDKLSLEVVPEDGIRLDKATGQVILVKSGDFKINAKIKEESLTDGLSLPVDPVKLKVRIEGSGETILKPTNLEITNLNLKQGYDYYTNLSFDQPVASLALVAGAKAANIDTTDRQKFDMQGQGTFLKTLGNYTGGDSTTPADNIYGGWTYYVNNKFPLLASGLGAGISQYVVQDGDYINFSYMDNYKFSSYVYFEPEEYEVEAGQELNLQLNRLDVEGMGSTPTSLEGIALLNNGKKLLDSQGKAYKTDEQGKVTIKLDEPGTYDLSAEKFQKNSIPAAGGEKEIQQMAISRPYAKVVVKEKPEQAIDIPDPVLRKEILTKLKLKDKKDLTKEKMKKLTYLYIYTSSGEVKTLEGLEYAENLQKLTINGSPHLDSLKPISKLSKLEKLNLNSNELTNEKIKDLAGLEGSSLKDLSLDSNLLTDISPLGDLIQGLESFSSTSNTVKLGGEENIFEFFTRDWKNQPVGYIIPQPVKDTVTIDEGSDPNIIRVLKKSDQEIKIFYKSKNNQRYVKEFGGNIYISTDQMVFTDKVKVTFDPDNGGPIQERSITRGKVYSLGIPAPEKPGWKFLGWYEVKSDGSLDNEAFDFTRPLAKDYKLKAKWEQNIENITVTFDRGLDFGSPIVKEIKQGSPVEALEVKKFGYIFKGWYQVMGDGQVSPQAFDFSQKIEKNITLKALWEKDPETSFTVGKYREKLLEYYETVRKYDDKYPNQLTAKETAALTKAGFVPGADWKTNDDYMEDYPDKKGYFGAKAQQALILIDLDKDPRNYKGQDILADLVKGLNNPNMLAEDNNTNYLRALIAVNKYNQKGTKPIDYNRDQVFKNLKSMVAEDGGIKGNSDSGTSINTALMLQAMEYMPDSQDKTDLINTCLEYLQNIRKSNHAIYTTIQTTAYQGEILKGLLAVGEDPTSSKWQSGDRNPIEVLFDFVRPDGSFKNAESDSETSRSWLAANLSNVETLNTLIEKGYGDYQIKSVNLDENGEVVLKDPPVYHTLTIEVEPKQAQVLVTKMDGTKVFSYKKNPEDPDNVYKLAAGQYKIKVTEEGYKPEEQTLDLAGDKTVKIQLKVDKTKLEEAIAKAEKVKKADETSQDGTDVATDETWVTPAVQTAFDQALKKAKAVNEKTDASQDEVNQAAKALEDAIKAYKPQEGTKEAVLPVDKAKLKEALSQAEAMKKADATSEDGKDVDKGKTWVTPAVQTAFNQALKKAKAVNEKTDASQDEVNQAAKALEDAIKAYKPQEGTKEAVLPVDKAKLKEILDQAEAMKKADTTSADGKDVDTGKTWVTPAVQTAFDQALKKAKEVNEKTDASQDDVNQAATVLEKAIKDYQPTNGRQTIEKRTEVKTEVIPFEKKVVKDSSQYEDYKQLVQKGKNGERKITEEVTYVNGKETARKELSSEVTIKPVDEIVRVGTKRATEPSPSTRPRKPRPSQKPTIIQPIQNIRTEEKKEDDITVKAGSPFDKMTDLVNHWARNVIKYVMDQGYFTGTSETTFSPDRPITRGEFVTVLGRRAKIDANKYPKSGMLDMEPGAYYEPYINWALSEGILQGVGGQKVEPNRRITREEMGTILNRYLEKEKKAYPQEKVKPYVDGGEISSWAEEAVNKLSREGLLAGRDNHYFVPKGNFTRGEVAQVLYNVDKK